MGTKEEAVSEMSTVFQNSVGTTGLTCKHEPFPQSFYENKLKTVVKGFRLITKAINPEKKIQE